ncbi:hypothetical protein [Actinophytocola sp.]|uniref:hypothetical protein n=1 Tax=Actinophytocola sp. TaxID=1872138 RepID=UPI002D2868CF|nr:hypothetical protein [Actinophytocola sp.]HYQ62875.1 hypothetical protein [Actinophytocola sp.]
MLSGIVAAQSRQRSVVSGVNAPNSPCWYGAAGRFAKSRVRDVACDRNVHGST